MTRPRSTRPDRRVVRTRTALRKALFALVREKDYDAITVQDIVNRADLRRATFYLHYDDKDDLLLSALQEPFERLTEDVEAVSRGHTLAGKTRLEAFAAVFAHMAQNAALYRAVFEGTAGVRFQRRIRDYLEAHVLEGVRTLPADRLSAPADVIAGYIAAAAVGLIAWWLENDAPYHAERMAVMAHQLVLHGALGAVGEQEKH